MKDDLSGIRTVFLDYDGCLHDTIRIYAPAFRAAQDYLAAQGLATRRSWSDEEIQLWIGYTRQEMWYRHRPDLPSAVREATSEVLGDHLRRLSSEGKACLYPGARETLQQLKACGMTLILISNSRLPLLQRHAHAFGLDGVLDGIVSADQFPDLSKSAILERIRTDYPERQIMVGDRLTDVRAGHENGLPAIGCLYGYAAPGELDEADVRISDVSELIPVLCGGSDLTQP